MPKLPKHIEERFDKEFEDYGGEYSNTLDVPRSLVESFIATILEEERKKIIDVINKYDDTRHNQEANETVRDIITLINNQTIK